jgi:hypothetical protein
MLQSSKGLQQIRNPLAEAGGTSEEDLKGVRIAGGCGMECVQADTVGDEVELGCRDSHLEEGTQGDAGGDGDGVGLGVDGLLAEGVARIGDGAADAPEGVLLAEDILLKTLMSGASVAEEDAAMLL